MSGYDRLRSNVAAVSSMAAGANVTTRVGLVSSYDGAAGKFLVKVRLQPQDTETGWLPIMTAQAGAAWGIYAAPAIGDMAVILFQEGDVEAGICVGFLGNDEDPPPAVEPGEVLLIHQDADAFIKLQADGAINSKGTWTHEGTFHATENITTEADVIDYSDGASGVTLKTLRDDYNAHKHGGVTAGGAMTAITDTPAN